MTVIDSQIKTEEQVRGDHSEQRRHRLVVDLRWAIAGGAVSALVLFVVVAAVGWVDSFQALTLLSGALPTIRFFASGTLAAAATILALMLTLLGLTYSTDFEFKRDHFHRIRQLAVMNTATIIMSILLLLLIGVPLQEAESLRSWYSTVYFAITGAASLLGGLMITTVLMVNSAIRELAAIGEPGGESSLLVDS